MFDMNRHRIGTELADSMGDCSADLLPNRLVGMALKTWMKTVCFRRYLTGMQTRLAPCSTPSSVPSQPAMCATTQYWATTKMASSATSTSESPWWHVLTVGETGSTLTR